MSWTETETAWIDTESGLAWEKEFKTHLNHSEAESWAKEQGKRLPTKEEFEVAEKHGIRFLKNIEWKRYCFWSSSLYPGYSDDAYAFNGGDGSADDYRRYSYYGVAVRFVSRVCEPGVKVDSKLDPLAERNRESLALDDEIAKGLK